MSFESESSQVASDRPEKEYEKSDPDFLNGSQ